MARYIDADELFRETTKKIHEANSYRMAVVDSEFLDLIRDAPTADVVEVVRCKDCKCYIPDNKLNHSEYHNLISADGVCENFDKYINETDFCSYGKRKEITDDTKRNT